MSFVEARLYAWGGAVGAGVLSARRAFTERLGTLVVLVDDEGRYGLGEATPLDGFSVESHGEAASALVALDWAALAESSARSRGPLSAAPAELPASARFALETALSDLAARRVEMSLSSWLAGPGIEGDSAHANRSPPLRSVLLGRLDAIDVQECAARALGRGALSLKAKATYDDAAAEARALARVRAVAGPEVELRLDLNGGLGVEAARMALAHYADLGVTCVEEPTRGAMLLELGPTPIPWLADESLVDPTIAASLSRDPHCGGFVLKPTLLGGIARVIALARSLGKERSVVLTHAFEGPVALAAVAEVTRMLGGRVAGLEPHAALAAFAPMRVEQVDGDAKPLAVRAASRPGLGLEVDEAALQRLGAPRLRWRAAGRA